MPLTQNANRWCSDEYLNGTSPYSSPGDPPREELGSRNEGFSLDGGVNASVILRVDWDDRWTLISDIAGNRLLWPGTEINQFFRPKAKTARIEGVASRDNLTGSLDQVLTYKDALIRFEYEYLETGQGIGTGSGGSDPSASPIEYFTEEIEPVTDFIRLDHRRFAWDNTLPGTDPPATVIPTVGGPDIDAIKENQAPGKQDHLKRLKRTHFRIRNETILGEILSKVGNVNDADYTSNLLGITFTKETLLLEGAFLRRSFIANAVYQGWDLTMSFVHRQQGWNRYWREDKQNYFFMLTIPVNYGGSYGLYRSYPLADFSNFLY